MQNGAKFPRISAGIFLKTYSRESQTGIPGGLGFVEDMTKTFSCVFFRFKCTYKNWKRCPADPKCRPTQNCRFQRKMSNIFGANGSSLM